MPYINKSTLTLPATSAFPNGIWEDTRNPTLNDYRNFQVGVTWINFLNKSVWFMVDKTATEGFWVQAATSGTGILDITGNTGGPVGPDGSNNINIIGGGTLSIAGNPGTNTLTITQSGIVATEYDEDTGSAIPSAGILKILGGSGVATSGSGNTVTITATSAVPLSFVEDAGTATPSANSLNVFGGTGITTSGAGSTVTVATTGTVATLYTENSGTAAPSGHNLNILGSGGITTSGAGSTVTVTAGVTIPTLFTENAGTATPSGNNLNILGASGITTSGAGSTVTISPGTTLATLYTEDTGTAAPSGNNLNIKGGTAITTSGAGSTVTINAGPTIATTYTEDSGSAVPAANALRIIGGTGISTSGAGNTVTITNTSTSSLTFQEDAGTATPAAGVIMIRGGAGISTSGAGSTVTITSSGISTYYSLTPYIVGSDVHSQFTTIQAAITQAVSDGAVAATPANIYIKPGVYPENPVLKDGINLIAFSSNARTVGGLVTVAPLIDTSPVVKIAGKVTYLPTGNNDTSASMTNITVEPTAGNTDAIVFTSSSAAIGTDFFTMNNCVGVGTGTGVGFNYAAATGNANVYFNNCYFSKLVDNSNSILSGNNSYIAGTAVLNFSLDRTFNYCTFGGAVTITNTNGATQFYNCVMNSTMNVGAGGGFLIYDCQLNGTITSAATINYGNIAFSGESGIPSATTTIPLNQQFGNTVLSQQRGSGTVSIPATTIYYANTGSGTSTASLPSTGVANGQVFIIKDENGNAGTNNITVNVTGGVKTIDGAATKTINTNFGVLRVIYTGTNYFTW